MTRSLIVGIDGTLIQKEGKGVSVFLLSFLKEFASKPELDVELVVFITKGAKLPLMPQHSQIRYVPVKVIKHIIWDLWGFDKSLKRIKADIALTLNDRVNIGCKYLLYYFEVPDHRIATNCENAGWYQRISDQLTRCFLKRTFTKAHHIAVSSAFTKGDLLNLYNVPEDKVSVVYAAPLAIFKPSNSYDEKQRIKQKYKAKDGYILHFSSNNDPRDNTGTLLKAFKLSLARIPSGYKLAICGVNKLHSFGWGETLRALGLENKVFFPGFLLDKELLEIYQGADLYVDTSLYEGFGYQVAEAMACGVPVVCSDVSSLPEVGGDAAVYVDQNNEQEISDVIVSIAGNGQKMKEMAKKGLEEVKRFSVERTARELVGLLRSISTQEHQW